MQQQLPPFNLEQIENNMKNLMELLNGAETLLRTKTQQEGSSSLAVQQLRASTEAAKEKLKEGANIYSNIKKYLSAQEKRNAEKRLCLTKEELEKLSFNVTKVYEKSNYRGYEEYIMSTSNKFARTKEQWNKMVIGAVLTCQFDWEQCPPVLIGKVGEIMRFGIFLKEAKTGTYFPYSVRVFGIEEDVQYWRWSKYHIFRIISERAQAALSYYMEQTICSNDTVEKGLDSLLEWLKSHETLEDWELSFDMASNSFLLPCVRSFQKPLECPARHPHTCVSPKHRKLNSFLGIHSR